MVFDGEITVPDSNTFPPFTTKESPYPIPALHYAVMNGGWKYLSGTAPVPPAPFVPPPTNTSQSLSNSNQAKILLSASDWTSIPAVADPEQSNPYLTNQSEWLYYRSNIRDIALNPPEADVNWPPAPQELWSN